ncbi:ammonium transporter [Ramlibacter sp. G-1-2-2]|uniref:Ammonium transporter n=1 Tax=Ramlibacter agri TaxID=2728837 RepID=A0A848H2I8_9BURK|nr:ammonium transporter [Ramlibacter agri]
MRKLPLLLVPCALGAGLPAWAQSPPLTHPGLVPVDRISGADTAWMIAATALVLLMTLPGIALFYGGMVRRKSVINTMASVMGITALVSVLWFAISYSFAFTPGNGFLGGVERAGFAGMEYLKDAGQVAVSHAAPNVPESVYAMFQLTFAIITAALVMGSVVERMKFSALMIFIALWSVCVYAPIAHWVWEPGGWLASLGVLDFAGGSVVHINAGVTGLVCAYALGPRRGYGREAFEPYSLALTMCGSGLLWVGWFGFNAGSAVAADGRAGLAMLVTHVAAAAGSLGWMAGELVLRRRASLLGLCSGVVAGLVAITPASGYVTPPAALLIGLVAGLVCYWGATGLKRLLRADDSLDVFGVHAVGGIVGSLLTGVLADKGVSGVQGSLAMQALGVVSVFFYSAFATMLLLAVTRLFVSLRVGDAVEAGGLDLGLHNERIGS